MVSALAAYTGEHYWDINHWEPHILLPRQESAQDSIRLGASSYTPATKCSPWRYVLTADGLMAMHGLGCLELYESQL